LSEESPVGGWNVKIGSRNSWANLISERRPPLGGSAKLLEIGKPPEGGEMQYPEEFSIEARARVETEKAAASKVLALAKENLDMSIWGPSVQIEPLLREYILRVFIVFVHEAMFSVCGFCVHVKSAAIHKKCPCCRKTAFGRARKTTTPLPRQISIGWRNLGHEVRALDVLLVLAEQCQHQRREG
jgi:hypothetical protein